MPGAMQASALRVRSEAGPGRLVKDENQAVGRPPPATQPLGPPAQSFRLRFNRQLCLSNMGLCNNNNDSLITHYFIHLFNHKHC